jgi:threonine/homoserine/homoserine lactone efflux protein
MGAAIGAVLGNAVGVAISPVPVIALILMLFSKSARTNAPLFLVGWVLGLLVVGVVVLGLGLESGSGTSTVIAGVLKIVIGITLLYLAVGQWRKRPREGEEASMPGWMASIDEFGAGRSLGFGILLSAANPKNLGLTIAAVASIGAQDMAPRGEILVLVVFVVLASLSIAAPVVYYLVAGDRAERTLTAMKAWLTANNATVMTVVLVVLGAKVLGDGLGVVF